MENNIRTYQVAHSYNQYSINRGSNRFPFSTLPFSISEEQGSQPTVPESIHENIFRNYLEPPPTKMATIPSTSYQYVGAKQIKSYLLKVQKRKRNMNSMVKRSTISGLSASRVSQLQMPQERYLTKEEVLGSSKLNLTNQHSFLQQTYASNQQGSNQNSTFISTLPNTTLLNQRKLTTSDFSMRKVMKKMKRYQNGWNQQTAERAATGPPSRRKDLRLTSILSHVDGFRDKVEQKSFNSFKSQIENIQPKLWGAVLRKSQTLSSLCNKQIDHVVREGISTAGKNKLSRQMSWIQEKDRQGHFFKVQKDSTHNQKA